MAYEFKLPNLGESIDGADVTNILVKVGDTVEDDQSVLELETDKSSMEVPVNRAGVVKEIRVKEGEKAMVGSVVLVIEEADGDSAAAPEEKAEPAKAAPAEAAAPAKEAPAAPAAAAPAAPKPTPEAASVPTSIGDRRKAPAAPSVRRFAREIGIDITQVPGAGPGGRISIADVKVYAKRQNEGRGPIVGSGGGVEVPALPDFSRFGGTSSEPMNNIRRKTAEHMNLCWNTIPHVTQFDKADITQTETLRKKYAKRAEAAGGKLTITAVLLKVACAALKKFPQFNSSVDMPGQQIVYRQYINIGVAVDTPRGLLVPVIRDVDTKNIVELSAELSGIAERARTGKIGPDDLAGGCFTITNIGGIGGTNFTPIVNWPEVAILGVARGAMEPVWDGAAFQPRMMCPMALSYDHRVIDGADGARFLRWIAEALENPFLMSLEG